MRRVKLNILHVHLSFVEHRVIIAVAVFFLLLQASRIPVLHGPDSRVMTRKLRRRYRHVDAVNER